jgi:hypothetical protein
MCSLCAGEPVAQNAHLLRSEWVSPNAGMRRTERHARTCDPDLGARPEPAFCTAGTVAQPDSYTELVGTSQVFAEVPAVASNTHELVPLMRMNATSGGSGAGSAAASTVTSIATRPSRTATSATRARGSMA